MNTEREARLHALAVSIEKAMVETEGNVLTALGATAETVTMEQHIQALRLAVCYLVAGLMLEKQDEDEREGRMYAEATAKLKKLSSQEKV